MEQIVAAVKQHEVDTPAADIVRKLDIAEQTIYSWKKQDGGLEASEVRNLSVLVAIGVAEDGFRTVLGVGEGANEDKASWSGFLRHLKNCVLKGVQLVISDACLGLVEDAAEHYPEAKWKLRRPLLQERLLLGALDEDARDRSHAQGRPRPRGSPDGS